MDKRLEGRIVLLTGAGRMRGIGRATARYIAMQGAAVVVSSQARDPATFPEDEKACGWQGALSVAAEIENLGGQAIAVDCDVTDPAQVAAMVEAASRKFGTPDAVVNNAGVAGGAGAETVLDVSDELWSRTIDVNLTGVFNVCKAVGRAMRAAERPGAIVNIASISARVGMPFYGAYCASKFGVIGLTQQMAVELGRYRIRVNAICPGAIDTDMLDGTFHRTAERSGQIDFDTIRKSVARGIPLRRRGVPEDLAAAVAFLLSSEASYITGQTLNVDGGYRMD